MVRRFLQHLDRSEVLNFCPGIPDQPPWIRPRVWKYVYERITSAMPDSLLVKIAPRLSSPGEGEMGDRIAEVTGKVLCTLGLIDAPPILIRLFSEPGHSVFG